MYISLVFASDNCCLRRSFYSSFQILTPSKMGDAIEKFDWSGFLTNGFLSNFGLRLTINERRAPSSKLCIRFSKARKNWLIRKLTIKTKIKMRLTRVNHCKQRQVRRCDLPMRRQKHKWLYGFTTSNGIQRQLTKMKSMIDWANDLVVSECYSSRPTSREHSSCLSHCEKEVVRWTFWVSEIDQWIGRVTMWWTGWSNIFEPTKRVSHSSGVNLSNRSRKQKPTFVLI